MVLLTLLQDHFIRSLQPMGIDAESLQKLLEVIPLKNGKAHARYNQNFNLKPLCYSEENHSIYAKIRQV